LRTHRAMAHFAVKLLLLLLLEVHLLFHHVAGYRRLRNLHWEPDRVHLRVHVSLLTIARMRVRNWGSRRTMTKGNRGLWWGRRLDRRVRRKLLL
jgi:hypothetical protein